MDFLETRVNMEIRYGAVGGPEFSTELITLSSGAEGRLSNWEQSRGQWVTGDDVYDKAQTEALIAFFRERKGKAGGFRFKDWSDWSATLETGVFLVIPGSTTTLQLAKKYVNGANVTYRPITKPVPGKIAIYSSGSLITPTIDYTTGIVTLSSTGTYSWAGEFDVPARFNSDKLVCRFEGYRASDGEKLFTISGLSVVELAPHVL